VRLELNVYHYVLYIPGKNLDLERFVMNQAIFE